MDALSRIVSGHGVLERDVLDRDAAHMIDRLLSRMASVERYRMVRKYCRGTVVDAACGTGYGSWLISKCPAVDGVLGLDGDLQAVCFARAEYPEVAYAPADFCARGFPAELRTIAPDTVVSLETIEHLPDVPAFIAAVLASGASRFVVSFPSFETVTFNPYHLRDWTPEEVSALVGRPPVKAVCMDDAVWVLVFDL